MIVQRIPFVDYRTSIYPGIVLTNPNNTEAEVMLKSYQLSSMEVSGLSLYKTISASIPPNGVWKPPPDSLFKLGKTYSVFVYGDVHISMAMTTMDGAKINCFGFEPPMQLTTLEQAVMERGDDKVQIGESPFYYFLGDCNYMRSNVRGILEMVAMDIFYRWKDREDRKLCIYDSVPAGMEPCPEHLGAHSGYRAWDFDTGYFTLKTNSTQARGEVTEIWKDRNDPESKLLDVFDLERNTYFFNTMKAIFPNLQIKVDERIEDALIAYNPIMKWLRETGPRANNHHFHPHFGLAGDLGALAINWEYII